MTLRSLLHAVLAISLTLGAITIVHSASPGRLVYIGTYTGDVSKGIYAFRFDDGTGALTPVGLVAETKSPSFLAVSPNRKFLYAVNEISSFEGEKAGSVTAFRIDEQDRRSNAARELPRQNDLNRFRTRHC